jgi:hypothetical protein
VDNIDQIVHGADVWKQNGKECGIQDELHPSNSANHVNEQDVFLKYAHH